MNRRGLFKRLGAAAAVVAVGAAAEPAQAAAMTEQEEVAALVNRVMESPEMHPAIMEQARKYMGESSAMTEMGHPDTGTSFSSGLFAPAPCEPYLSYLSSYDEGVPYIAYSVRGAVLPSYGGVYLTRNGKQVVCATGDDVHAALQDDSVTYHQDRTTPRY